MWSVIPEANPHPPAEGLSAITPKGDHIMKKFLNAIDSFADLCIEKAARAYFH